MKIKENPLLLLQSELNRQVAVNISLEKENNSLKELVAMLITENKALKDQVFLLKEQMAWLQKQIFGPRSEKETSMPGSDQQSNFFDLLEIPLEAEKSSEEVSPPEKKNLVKNPIVTDKTLLNSQKTFLYKLSL